MLAAPGGDGGHIWLLGSDAGVAPVADAFRDRQGREGGVEVCVDPVRGNAIIVPDGMIGGGLPFRSPINIAVEADALWW
jgi:hypothetical protein